MAELADFRSHAAAPDAGELDAKAAAEREWARKRIERKRKLRADVMAYVVINLLLIAAWAATGFGYFWPGWVLVGWGGLLLLDIWNTRYHVPITDEDIDRELRHGG